MEETHRWVEKENPLRSEVLADDTGRDHEKRLARYAKAKDRQQVVTSYMVAQKDQVGKFDLGRELKALQECGEFLIYRHYYEKDVYRLRGGCTCKKHLLCALCAIRRAAKCIAVYSEKIATVIDSGPKYDQLLITFTVKNGYNLVERMDHLKASFGKLIQKRRASLVKNPKTDTEFKHVQGAIYSYETTFNEDEGFHPHIHMLALVPQGQFRYTEMTIKNKRVKVPVSLWRDLKDNWQTFTEDSFIVDVRLIESQHDQLAALVETFKYALKLSDLDVAVQVDAYRALRGRRLIGSMGALFGVKLPENLDDDLLPSEEKYIDIVYQYSGVFGYQEASRGYFEPLPNKQDDPNFDLMVIKWTRESQRVSSQA